MNPKEELEMNEFHIDEPQELSIEEQISEKTKPDISKDEKSAIIRFILLFFVLGFPAGFQASATLLLQGNGLTSESMAFWTTTLYPLSFKLLLAPFIDSLYINWFGRRKTYIIPSFYMIGFTFLTLAYCGYSDWFKDLNLYPLLGLTTFLIVLQTIGTIATNGWVLSSFSKHYVHLGGPCQVIGQTCGNLFSYAVLMNLTSKFFCQHYLGLSEPIISLDNYAYLIGGSVIFITIMIQILTKEENKEEENLHFSSVIKQTLSLLNNKNIRFLLLILFTKFIAFAPVIASNSLNLIQMGIPHSEFAFIVTLTLPSQLIAPFVVGKYLKRGKELTCYLYCLFALFLITGLFFIFVTNFMLLGGYNSQTKLILFILQLLYQIQHSFAECIFTGFVLRIADPLIGGTYATLLYSTSILGSSLSQSLALFLLHFLPYRTLTLLGWLFGLIYFTAIKDRFLSLQYFDLKSWKVSQIN